MNRLAALILTSFGALGPLMADEGFIPIFDGETLAGWKSNEETPGAFSVDADGSLKVSGGRAHLFYVGDQGETSFRDFELKLKVKTTKGSNSGIFLGTEYQEKGWPKKGYEAQVNSSHSDPRSTGSLYSVADIWVDPEQKQAPFLEMHEGASRLRIQEALSKDGEWFNYHIIVKGREITLKVNGVTVVQFTESRRRTSRRAKKLGKGTIALQAHDPDSTVFYQEIQLKITD